jgi:hypothetical protein
MGLLRRYRVGLTLVGLAIVLGVLTAYRLKDQQARAVPRARSEVLVGVVQPECRDLEVKPGQRVRTTPASRS